MVVKQVSKALFHNYCHFQIFANDPFGLESVGIC